MFMRISDRIGVDADVSDNGRAFRVRQTIHPEGVRVTHIVSSMRSQTFKHSIVRKCKKKG